MKENPSIRVKLVGMRTNSTAPSSMKKWACDESQCAISGIWNAYLGLRRSKNNEITKSIHSTRISKRSLNTECIRTIRSSLELV